jgi:hypothetical protein
MLQTYLDIYLYLYQQFQSMALLEAIPIPSVPAIYC